MVADISPERCVYGYIIIPRCTLSTHTITFDEKESNPAIPLLGKDPKESKAGTQTNICDTDVRGSIIHGNQEAKAIQVSRDNWTDKQCGAYIPQTIILP